MAKENEWDVRRVTGPVKQVGQRGAHITLPGDWVGMPVVATLRRSKINSQVKKRVTNFGNSGHILLPLSWKGKIVTVVLDIR